MEVVKAGLKKFKFPNVDVTRRGWGDLKGRSPSLRLGGADVGSRAHTVPKRTKYGYLTFKGFRVFARVDGLSRLLQHGDGAIAKAAGEVFDILLDSRNGRTSGNNTTASVAIRERIKVQDRALLVIHSGMGRAPGDAFDEILPAVKRLANVHEYRIDTPTPSTDDERFRDFVVGNTSIYCGGAIKGLLIDTWWGEAFDGQSPFVEILSSDEIHQGISEVHAKGANGERESVIIENQVVFGGTFNKCADQAARRRASTEFVKFVVAVGRGLARWAEVVLQAERQGRLGRLSGSCKAAQHILRPLSINVGRGHMAFVTKATDAAWLVKHNDCFH